MDVTFPVTLENGLTIAGNEAPFTYENEKFNGTDAGGNRITNIVGFDGEYLLKWCPHCEDVYPCIDFGPEGRSTGHANHRRDQSWCTVCRRG